MDPENVKREAQQVLRALLTRPRLRKQADIIQRYYAPDVNFFNIYADVAEGRDNLTAVYQLGQLFLGYERVEFGKVVYDPIENAIALQMQLFVRPHVRLGGLTQYPVVTLLELEDFYPEGAETAGRKPLKRIKKEGDFYQRAPYVVILPIIGDIYNSHALRLILGRCQALALRLCRGVLRMALPKEWSHGLLGLWDRIAYKEKYGMLNST